MALDTYTNLKATVADYLARTDLTNQIPDFIRLAEKRIETKLNFVPNKNDTYTTSATMTAGQNYIYAPIGCVEPIHMQLDGSPLREVAVVTMKELTRIAQANTSGIPRAMTPVGNMRSGTIISFAADSTRTACNVATGHGIVAGDWVHISEADSVYNGRWLVYASDTNDFTINQTYSTNPTLAKYNTYQMRLLFDEAPSSALDYTLFYRAEMKRLGDPNASGRATEVTWLLSEWPNLILYGALLEATPFIKDDPRLVTWGTMFKEAMDDAKRSQWRRRISGGELRIRPDVLLV